MPFNQEGFGPVGGQSHQGPALYSYTSLTDLIAEISSGDYFAEKSGVLKQGDMIRVFCPDSYQLLDVINVIPGGVITQISTVGPAPDVNSDDVENVSTVAGATVSDALETLSSQIPTNAVEFKGAWDANTNTPTLASGVGNLGDFWRVSASGSTNLDGIDSWVLGDSLIFNGTVWERYATAEQRSDNVSNDSTVTGSTVTDALDALETGKQDAGLNVEDFPTTETDPGKLLIADVDNPGETKWATNPIGAFFQDDITMTGSEIANRFIYNGDSLGDKDFTLAPAASVTAGEYIILIENQSALFNPDIDVATQGGDTLIAPDGAAVAVGETMVVEKTGATEYSTYILTPAQVSALAGKVNAEGPGINSTDYSSVPLWELDASTVMADPGAGKIRFNNADATLATKFAISTTTSAGQAFGALLSLLRPNISITGSEHGANNYVISTILGIANNGTWFEVDINVLAGANYTGPGTRIGIGEAITIEPLGTGTTAQMYAATGLVPISDKWNNTDTNTQWYWGIDSRWHNDGEWDHREESLAILVNSTTTPVDKVSFPYLFQYTGDYEVKVEYQWNGDSTIRSFRSGLTVDGAEQGEATPYIHVQEPKDSGNSGGPTVPGTGSAQRLPFSATIIYNEGTGATSRTVAVPFSSSFNGVEASMWNLVVKIKYIGGL